MCFAFTKSLWLALSAAVPSNWGPVSVFFIISVILGILDWPGLARSVRAKFLALREEEYVRAANGFLAERFLYGSSYPFIGVKAYAEWFSTLPIRPELLRKLQYQNAARFLGITS